MKPPEALALPTLGGPHGVTAEFPTLDHILRWKEGHCTYANGYYRLVESPFHQVFRESLQRPAGSSVSLFPSLRAAWQCALEGLLRLQRPHVLEVLAPLTPEPWAEAPGALAGFPLPVSLSLPHRLPEVTPAAVWLLFHPEPESWLTNHPTELDAFAAQGGRLLVVTPQLPQAPLPRFVQAWCVPLVHEGDLSAVFSPDTPRVLKELAEGRKKRGAVVSTRTLERHRQGLPELPTRASAAVLQQLQEWEHATAGALFPSGMAAVTAALDLVRRPERSRIVVVGLLYGDTYGFLEARTATGSGPVTYLSVSDAAHLPDVLGPDVAAVLTETLTNPLLEVPDLRTLAAACRSQDIPLIVDNTFATPLNCQPLEEGADLVIHSTTKYLSGGNDHGGGVVLTQQRGLARMLQRYQAQWGLRMAEEEAVVLQQRLHTFPERLARFNANGKQLARFLKRHSGTQAVFHGSLQPRHQRPAHLSGFGGVVSFQLQEDSLAGLRRFYDALGPPLHKAPSLGSDQTLLCPYALLAHYHEPDAFFREHGLSRYLVRVAAGSEPHFTPVLEQLDQALLKSLQPNR